MTLLAAPAIRSHRVLALTVSMVVTGSVSTIMCGRPVAHPSSWREIVARASAYLVVAAIVHVLAVWVTCRAFFVDEAYGEDTLWLTVCSLWAPVSWLPLLVLLAAGHSPWIAMFIPVLVGCSVLSLFVHLPENDIEVKSDTAKIWRNELRPQNDVPLWYALFPSLLTAVAIQTGIGMIISHRACIAGVCFSAGILYVATRRLQSSSKRVDTVRIAAGSSCAVWVFLVFALGRLFGTVGPSMAALLGLSSVHAPSSPSKAAARGTISGYTGIILLQPMQPHELTRPVRSASVTQLLSKPRTILFDGSYWYMRT